jgi:hypothetical protein
MIIIEGKYVVNKFVKELKIWTGFASKYATYATSP